MPKGRFAFVAVSSDISEIVQDDEVSINTGLYMNPAKATASTRSANSEEFGSFTRISVMAAMTGLRVLYIWHIFPVYPICRVNKRLIF